jgi:hypothetical protein
MWCLVRLPFLFVIGYVLCVIGYDLRVMGYDLCVMHNALCVARDPLCQAVGTTLPDDCCAWRSVAYRHRTPNNLALYRSQGDSLRSKEVHNGARTSDKGDALGEGSLR